MQGTASLFVFYKTNNFVSMILSLDDFFNKDVFCCNDDSRSTFGLSVVLFHGLPEN